MEFMEIIEDAVIEQDKVIKSEGEWRRQLTPEQYFILREKGTEVSFTGRYWNESDPGIYVCAACGNELFSSFTKFNGGCGLPSYWKPLHSRAVRTTVERGLFGERTEVLCARCDSHLGYVHDDGPPPTGMRYSINSAALELVPE